MIRSSAFCRHRLPKSGNRPPKVPDFVRLCPVRKNLVSGVAARNREALLGVVARPAAAPYRDFDALR